jgi:hypothetical protein
MNPPVVIKPTEVITTQITPFGHKHTHQPSDGQSLSGLSTLVNRGLNNTPTQFISPSIFSLSLSSSLSNTSKTPVTTPNFSSSSILNKNPNTSYYFPVDMLSSPAPTPFFNYASPSLVPHTDISSSSAPTVSSLVPPITTMYRRLLSSLKQTMRWLNYSGSLMKPLPIYLQSSSYDSVLPPSISFPQESMEYLSSIGLDYLFEGIFVGDGSSNDLNTKNHSLFSSVNDNNNSHKDDLFNSLYNQKSLYSPILSVDVLQYGPLRHMDINKG